MAARGGLGPTSPTSPISPSSQTYPMSPTITLERHPIVKFDSVTRSLDMPRSPLSPNSELQQTRHRKGLSKTGFTDRSTKDASGNWFSRLFGRKTEGEVQDDIKEYP